MLGSDWMLSVGRECVAVPPRNADQAGFSLFSDSPLLEQAGHSGRQKAGEHPSPVTVSQMIRVDDIDLLLHSRVQLIRQLGHELRVPGLHLAEIFLRVGRESVVVHT